MILFKEESAAEQSASANDEEQNFKFYTVVNNLSAVERPPKGFWEKISDGIKSVFYRSKKDNQ